MNDLDRFFIIVFFMLIITGQSVFAYLLSKMIQHLGKGL